jgi:hypothetical protein
MQGMSAVSPATEQTYGELRLMFEIANARLFEGALPHCMLTLQREKRTYGYFSFKRFGNLSGEVVDEIALNPDYFAVLPMVEVIQTLVHEMVHVWQYHYGKPGRGRYHNAEWADKMEAIGLMPSHTGMPGGRRVGDHMADYPLPGGRFVDLVNELVTAHQFGISWFDRYTAVRAPEPLAIGDMPAATVGGGPALDMPAAALAVAAAQGIRIEPRRPQSPTVGASNRVKYTCAGCGINAWGKPGLRLDCVACALGLEPPNHESP